ncbi:hypothetical protein C4577_01740 [Candidatus Parcubacteria bacterium]|nr:MAG: hypothetical protein C4577_01740 [Candidatus Parcubacteria bacterium]
MELVNKSAHFDTERSRSTQCKQRGFVASLPVIVGGVVVLVVVVLLVAGGNFQFSAKMTPTGDNQAATSEVITEKATEPTPIPSPVSIYNFKTFTSEDMNISFDYPEDWTVNENSKNVTIALIEEGTTNNAAVAITAAKQPLGSAKGLQFTSIVDLQKVAIKKEFNISGFTIDETAKIGSMEARLLGFDGNISGNSLTGRYLTTNDENNIYVMTVLADADKWSKYSADLQKTLDSFKLLK